MLLPRNTQEGWQVGVNSPNYPILGQGVLLSARALELPVGAMVPAEFWGQEDPRQETSHSEGFSQGKILSLLP